ncbi:MAG: hypothetical protein U0807_01660 [Candidatus Binatia bacterium]
MAIPMEEIARVRPLATPAPGAPGHFNLSTDGELARALLTAGFQAVAQERVQLSLLVHDADEFWALTIDTAGPLAPALASLTDAERVQVAAGVRERIARFRTGDVLRIPAQAQLAWGRA